MKFILFTNSIVINLLLYFCCTSLYTAPFANCCRINAVNVKLSSIVLLSIIILWQLLLFRLEMHSFLIFPQGNHFLLLLSLLWSIHFSSYVNEFLVFGFFKFPWIVNFSFFHTWIFKFSTLSVLELPAITFETNSYFPFGVQTLLKFLCHVSEPQISLILAHSRMLFWNLALLTPEVVSGHWPFYYSSRQFNLNS